jgi:hypothetical protein
MLPSWRKCCVLIFFLLDCPLHVLPVHVRLQAAEEFCFYVGLDLHLLLCHPLRYGQTGSGKVSGCHTLARALNDPSVPQPKSVSKVLPIVSLSRLSLFVRPLPPFAVAVAVAVDVHHARHPGGARNQRSSHATSTGANPRAKVGVHSYVPCMHVLPGAALHRRPRHLVQLL